MTVAIHSEDICCCSSLENKTCNVRACRGSYYRFDNNFYSCRTRSFSVRIVLRADGGNGKTTIVFKIRDKKKAYAFVKNQTWQIISDKLAFVTIVYCVSVFPNRRPRRAQNTPYRRSFRSYDVLQHAFIFIHNYVRDLSPVGNFFMVRYVFRWKCAVQFSPA